MRERAAALGGELTAGPSPAGWRVSCWLPLEGDPLHRKITTSYLARFWSVNAAAFSVASTSNP